MGTEGDDVMNSDEVNGPFLDSTIDVFRGMGGNDTIITLEGDDSLDGGTGNDYLDGGVGNDQYKFLGNDFGNDTIVDAEGNEEVIFNDLLSSKVTFSNTGEGILISVNDADSSVLIENGTDIESFSFENGSFGLADLVA